MESIQHVLDRVRKPRVQITYDVEIGDAIEMKELPFVMGIMADLSGKRLADLPKLKDRKFVDLDPDSFPEIMAGISPHVAFDVPSRLSGAADGDTVGVNLIFKTMDDFNPLSIAKQMNSLSGIYASRVKMSDLLTKLDGNDSLHDLLKSIMEDSAARDQLKSDLEAHSPSDGSENNKQ